MASTRKGGRKADRLTVETSGLGEPPSQVRASLRPQQSSQVISTTQNPANDLKWKRTSTLQSTLTRPSLPGSGPTGPLGLGSRLIASRRKQATAAPAIAQVAPMRSARTGTGAAVTSTGRNNASAKSIGKQLLSSSMLNTSQSSLRSSVIGVPHWGKAGGKATQAAQQTDRSAKALHGATGLWSKELSQSQFGATTNFAAGAVTAR